MPKNLLLYRLVIVNVLFVAALVAAWNVGWARTIWESDDTPISTAIVALFLLGLGSTAWRACDIQRLRKIGFYDYGVAGTVASRLQRIEHLHWIADWLTYIGFFGTVVGFSLTLSAAASAVGDASTIAGMMAGMKLSLATTLVGCVFGIWTEVNYLMLKTATVLRSEG